jgi:putative chitinase
LLTLPEQACLSAGWFWNKKGLNSLADSGDFETMTKRINGGLIGLDDRKAKIAKALSILG